MKLQCNEQNWYNSKKPCGQIVDVDEKKIVARERLSSGEDKKSIIYGFYCPKCRCFNQIDPSLLSDDIKKRCKIEEW